MKKKNLTVSLSILMAVLFMTSFILGTPSICVSAETTETKEEGTDSKSSKALPFDKAKDISEMDIVEDNNADGEDDHLYKFEVEKDGYIIINFEQKKDVGEHEIRIYNPEQEEIFQAVCEEDMETYTSPQFSIGKGINYINIHSNNNPELFTLSLQCEKNKYWESEPNDQIDQADEIRTDTLYKGNNVKKEDKDYYTFEAEENGFITISFDHSNGAEAHNLTLFDSDSKEYCKLKVEKDQETFTSQEISVNKGNNYLLIESPGNKDPYTFSVNYLAAEDWESESNNNPDQANAIENDTIYHGSNVSKDDSDYYSFTMDQDGEITIQFNQEKDVADHVITLYDTDKKEITSATAGRDVDKFTTEKIKVKKGKNYICIRSDQNVKVYSIQVKTK